MSKIRYGFILCAAVLCLAFLGSTGCRGESQPAGRSGFALDTAVSITLYAFADGALSSQALLDGCFAELERYEQLLSAEREDSDIGRLNQAEGKPVPLSEETIELLQIGLQYGKLTNGALDITIRPASCLWNFQGSPALPDPADLSAAAALVDYRNLHLDGLTAWLTDPDAAVDLGGIAKGYIADRLASYLTKNGVESALLDLGGNIVAIGDKEGEDWKIGVRDPSDENALAAVIPVQNAWLHRGPMSAVFGWTACGIIICWSPKPDGRCKTACPPSPLYRLFRWTGMPCPPPVSYWVRKKPCPSLNPCPMSKPSLSGTTAV